MPVLGGTCQPAHLQAEDQADAVRSDLAEQALETRPMIGAAPALALVLVADDDAIFRPAQGDSMIGQSILPRARLLMLHDLLRTRLTHINDGQAFQVPRLDLAAAWWSNPAALGRRGGPLFPSRLGHCRACIMVTHAPPP